MDLSSKSFSRESCHEAEKKTEQCLIGVQILLGLTASNHQRNKAPLGQSLGAMSSISWRERGTHGSITTLQPTENLLDLLLYNMDSITHTEQRPDLESTAHGNINLYRAYRSTTGPPRTLCLFLRTS